MECSVFKGQTQDVLLLVFQCSWHSITYPKGTGGRKGREKEEGVAAAASDDEMTFRTEQTHPAPDPNQNEH